MYADISFAPLGDKSHQGVLGFYGGALVQWESSRGDSLCAVLDIMEGGHNGGESQRR